MILSPRQRIVAALALTATLIMPASAFAARHGGRHDQAGGQTGRHGLFQRRAARRKVTISGTLLSLNGTTAPTSLSLQTKGVTVTVMVAGTTALLRRYNGRSNLAEFSPGDQLSVRGSYEAGSTTTFDALNIKNKSIQHAFTDVLGQVQSVANGTATLAVAHGRGFFSPYRHSGTIQVTFTSATIVMSGAVTSTVDAIQPGLNVIAMGLYDRHTQTLRAARVRIQVAATRHARRPRPLPPVTATEAAATDTATAVAPTATATAPAATATLTATATTVPTDTATATATLTATATVTGTVVTVP